MVPKENIRQTGDAVKTRMARDISEIMAQYYPASAVWWSLPLAEFGEWTDWNASQFRRQKDRWNAAVQSVPAFIDPEVRLWRSFGQSASRAIAAGEWRAPHAPLEHLTSRIRVWRWTRPDRTTGALEEFPWRSAARWLDRIELDRGGDHRERALAVWLARGIRRETGGRFGVERQVFWDALDRYARRLKALSATEPEPWPVGSRGVVAVDWKGRRERIPPRFERAASSKAVNGVDFAALLAPLFPHSPISEKIDESMAAHAWYFPTPRREVVRGEDAVYAAAAAYVLAWWRERADALHPLSWSLSDPAVIAGALRFLLHGVAHRRPASPAAASLNRELAVREMLSLVDAWLWLEGGEMQTVVNWLAERIGEAAARAGLTGIIRSPGQMMAAEWVRLELAQRLPSEPEEAVRWPFWGRCVTEWEFPSKEGFRMGERGNVVQWGTKF